VGFHNLIAEAATKKVDEELMEINDQITQLQSICELLEVSRPNSEDDEDPPP
jgi:hypothetical protein